MAVHSHFFGVTKLTGADSEKFHRQVTYGRPTKVASDALARGKKLLREFDKRGSVTVKLKKAK